MLLIVMAEVMMARDVVGGTMVKSTLYVSSTTLMITIPIVVRKI